MAKKKSKKTPDNVLAQNRKARHDYAVTETVEAGLVLTGTEIKSLRERRVNLQDGFAQIRNNEAWMMNVHISEYVQKPIQPRSVTESETLLHKKEIRRLGQATMDKGLP